MSEDMKEKAKIQPRWSEIFLPLHFLLLCVLIVVLWGALSLPVIFFNKPPKESPECNLSDLSQTCPATNKNMYAHNEPTCQAELSQALRSHNCSVPSGHSKLIPKPAAAIVQLAINKIELIRPSKECRDVIVPFLCLSLLVAHNDTGVYPTFDQCKSIKDNICRREWNIGLMYDIDLPKCDKFPVSSQSCDPDKNFALSSAQDAEVINNSTIEEKYKELPCTCSEDEGFYDVDNSSKCFPSCHTWYQFSNKVTTASDVIVILSGIIGFTVSILALILSCISYNRMFQFPSVMIIYMVIDTLIVGATLIVSLMYRNRLYCSSKDLIESLLKVTPFCVISGIIFEYVMFQLTLWWLCHIIMLFLKITFPLQIMAMGKTKTRLLHGFFVFAGLLLPLLPIITTMVDFAVYLHHNNISGVTFGSGGLGFGVIRFPPVLCYSKNKNVLFYSFILPIDIMLGLGCTLLLVIAWYLHRQHLKTKMTDSTMPLKIVAIVTLSVVTLNIRNFDSLQKTLLEFFSCEYNPANKCSRGDINKYSYPFTTATCFILLCFLPAVELVYIINLQEIKDKLNHWKRKRLHSNVMADVKLTSFSKV